MTATGPALSTVRRWLEHQPRPRHGLRPGLDGTDFGGAGTDRAGYIGGGMLQRVDFVQGPILIVDVDDIDGALSKVEQLGGKTVRGRQEVGQMGFAAYFKDPEGNLMGLWQNAPTNG